MNIVLDISNYSILNIYFLETKRNIIMDGTFTKFIYSNDNLILNSVYLYFPIEIQSIEKTMNKNAIRFYPSSENNMPLINELSKIEYRIIEYYKLLHKCKKRTVCLLTKQLFNGNLKVYRESNENSYKNRNIKYIIKLSGIWETYDDVGITYKLIECYT
uniref:Uncharacterized protein n=1 Tax=viral metagenome TaxID=1070528 RepID=A0A6C0DS16_9ZZZZ